MTQDFAKIRPEPLLERKPVETPPAWSLMFTGMIVGLAIGVFACVLFYLSGNVPPLNPKAPLPSGLADNGREPGADNSIATASADAFPLEFYTALKNYEVSVPVDAIPVELRPEISEQPLETSYMLQSGAFEQLALANSEMQRQQSLGLEVTVKREELPGRTLYLVQSGPYSTNGQLVTAEQLLRSNSIPSLRLSLQ